MRTSLIAVVFLFMACLIVAPQEARAEDKAKAVKLLDEGTELLEKGDRYWAANKPEKGIAAYEGALAAFNEAYENFNSPKLFYAIAEAEQKLYLYIEAMGHYQALLEERDNLSPELVKQAEAAIVEVRKNLSGLKFKVEQEGATISVEGKEIGVTPFKGTHYFSPGRVTYTITLDGFTPHEETLETKRGEVVARKVALEEMTVVVAKKKKKKKPTVISTPDKTPMTISFGLAGGFLVGATFTAIQAKARHDRYQDESVPTADREKARDRGKTYRLTTDILLGGAILAAGYGTYYYYSKYKPQKKEQALASVWVSPYASGNGGGVAMGATF